MYVIFEWSLTMIRCSWILWIISENNDKTARILALEEKSILQENTIEQLSIKVEKLQAQMTDTNTEFQEQATQLEKFQG